MDRKCGCKIEGSSRHWSRLISQTFWIISFFSGISHLNSVTGKCISWVHLFIYFHKKGSSKFVPSLLQTKKTSHPTPPHVWLEPRISPNLGRRLYHYVSYLSKQRKLWGGVIAQKCSNILQFGGFWANFSWKQCPLNSLFFLFSMKFKTSSPQVFVFQFHGV